VVIISKCVVIISKCVFIISSNAAIKL